MKQKLLLTFALLLTAVTGAWAWTSGACTVTLEGTILTVSGSGAMGDYGNPEDQPWHGNRSSITSIVIEDGVTRIGDEAFSGCTNLASVTIPDGVTSIGDGAFDGCTNLTTVNIGSKVSTIGIGAFDGCTNLATITVDGGNTTYDSRNNCNAIIKTTSNTLVVGCKGTTIPNTVTSIGSSAFLGSGLTSITLPASVASIGDIAFYNSSSLASVTVYATTPPTLGISAFENCKGSLKIYVFSDLVDTYKGAWSAYSGKITAMTNPNGTCGVAPNASDVRWVLTGTSPNYTLTIMKVGSSGAMEEFSGPNFQPWKDYRTFITSVVIEDGVTSIGDYAFDGCTGLTSVTIGSGVTTIGDYAFLGCNNASLTSITIPASVTSIGQEAFEDCTNLATVTFASGSQLTTIGGAAFNSTSLESITIPAGVTTIESSTFGLCSSLGTVNFATGSLLTTIDFSAFDGCTNLTSITIPAGVTSIGDGAFSGCTGLTSFTLPNGVTNIGMSAFNGCTNLNAVTLNSNPRIGADAFEGIKAGATVTMNLTANEGETGQYWMTFYNENYNFQADANTQVFKAALSGTKVSLTELATDKIVNKDNAVLLKSTASPIVMTLTSTNSENVFTGNDLNGVSDPAGKTDDGKMYVLNYTAANGVGFYKLATGSKLGVGKAYLSYSDGGASNFFGLDDDGTTGIDNGQWTIDNSDKVFYDLNGRRIMNPMKGLYIVNGKKVLLK